MNIHVEAFVWRYVFLVICWGMELLNHVETLCLSFLRNCWCFPKCLCYFKISLNTGDLSSIPGWGRSPGRGNGYPLQYSCLENSMDRGDWQATVTKSQTRLSNFHFHQGRRVHPSLMPWQHFDIVRFLNHSSGGEVVSHCVCI